MVSVIIAVLLLAALLRLQFGFGFVPAVAPEVIVEIVLSGLLVLLYKRQNDIQRNQTTILQSQNKLNRPILRTEGHQVRPHETGREELQVRLSNVGRTTAMDLRFGLYTGFLEEDQFESALTTVKLTRLESESAWNHSKGEHLDPSDPEVTYTAHPLLLAYDKPSNSGESVTTGSIKGRLEYLSENMESDNVRLRGVILYRDSTGEPFEEALFDRWYHPSIESTKNLNELLTGESLHTELEPFIIPSDPPIGVTN